MNKTEKDFLKTQELKPLVWLQYNGWKYEEAELKNLWRNLLHFYQPLNLCRSNQKTALHFLVLMSESSLHLSLSKC